MWNLVAYFKLLVCEPPGVMFADHFITGFYAFLLNEIKNAINLEQ